MVDLVTRREFQPISAIVNARVFDALCRKVFGMAKKFTESRDHSGHTERKQQATRFQPGQSGNPAGRPRGSKNKLSEDFWRDMSEAWEQGGVEAIKRVMQEAPAKFLTIVASACPRTSTTSTTPPRMHSCLSGRSSAMAKPKPP